MQRQLGATALLAISISACRRLSTPGSMRTKRMRRRGFRNVVEFSVKPTTKSDQEALTGVRLVSQAWFGESPGPLIGFGPADRIGATGLPYVSRRVAVVWGWHFPTCVLPRLGAKPTGDPALDRHRLGDHDLSMTKTSRRRLQARSGDINLTVERSGRLSVRISDSEGRPILSEKTTRAEINPTASPAVLSLAVGLWAADQTRSVWSIWRHLLNGI